MMVAIFDPIRHCDFAQFLVSTSFNAKIVVLKLLKKISNFFRIYGNNKVELQKIGTVDFRFKQHVHSSKNFNT